MCWIFFSWHAPLLINVCTLMKGILWLIYYTLDRDKADVRGTTLRGVSRFFMNSLRTQALGHFVSHCLHLFNQEKSIEITDLFCSSGLYLKATYCRYFCAFGGTKAPRENPHKQYMARLYMAGIPQTRTDSEKNFVAHWSKGYLLTHMNEMIELQLHRWRRLAMRSLGYQLSIHCQTQLQDNVNYCSNSFYGGLSCPVACRSSLYTGPFKIVN